MAIWPAPGGCTVRGGWCARLLLGVAPHDQHDRDDDDRDQTRQGEDVHGRWRQRSPAGAASAGFTSRNAEMAAPVRRSDWFAAVLRPSGSRDRLSFAFRFAVGIAEVASKRLLALPLADDPREPVSAHPARSIRELVVWMSHEEPPYSATRSPSSCADPEPEFLRLFLAKPRIIELDDRVADLDSADQKALRRARRRAVSTNKRRRRDSNPRYPEGVHRFSRPALSTTQAPLRSGRGRAPSPLAFKSYENVDVLGRIP